MTEQMSAWGVLAHMQEKIKREIGAAHKAAGVPAKIDTPLFPFQEYTGEFDELGTGIAGREDMYRFFRNNDPAVTYFATIELTGVRFDPLSYRQYSPLGKEELDERDLGQAAERAEKVAAVVREMSGEVLAAVDNSPFYLRVSGNAEMYLALAKLDEVNAIGLYDAPSNLREERAAQRRAELNAKWGISRAKAGVADPA